MKKNLYKLFGAVSAFALPALALAQDNIGTPVDDAAIDASEILGTISGIFGILIPILITFAVIWVIIGVIKYATAADDEAQATARKMIIHAIIALFVIVSIWGLVAILNATFGIGQGGSNTGVCQPVWDPVNNEFVDPPGC
jgi:hypothetical protein